MNTIDQAGHLHLVNLSELTSKSTLGQIDKIHASQLPYHENINTEYKLSVGQKTLLYSD